MDSNKMKEILVKFEVVFGSIERIEMELNELKCFVNLQIFDMKSSDNDSKQTGDSDPAEPHTLQDPLGESLFDHEELNRGISAVEFFIPTIAEPEKVQNFDLVDHQMDQDEDVTIIGENYSADHHHEIITNIPSTSTTTIISGAYFQGEEEDLNRNRKSSTIRSIRNQFKCSFCGCYCKNLQSLHKHKSRIHKYIKYQYQCTFCLVKFSKKSLHQEHIQKCHKKSNSLNKELEVGSNRNLRPIPEWERVDLFDDNWIEQISSFQTSLLPLIKFTTDPDIKKWFTYYYNPAKPEDSKYGCRLCTDNFDFFKIPSTKPEMALPNGTLKSSKQSNTNAINLHPKSPTHTTILNRLKENYEQNLLVTTTKNSQISFQKDDLVELYRSISPKKRFKCLTCGNFFKSSRSLSSHMSTHNKKYQCSFCLVKYSRKILLQTHIPKCPRRMVYSAPLSAKTLEVGSNNENLGIKDLVQDQDPLAHNMLQDPLGESLIEIEQVDIKSDISAVEFFIQEQS